MLKLTDLESADEVLERHLADPEYRAEYWRTRLASDVSIRVLKYRYAHGLSQTAFGRLVGMRQSHVCRLEAADNPPSIALLTRLAAGMGTTFTVEVGPEGAYLRDMD